MWEVEQYAACRASGQTIGVSATSAGIGSTAAKTLEKSPAVRDRISELREGSKTTSTVSAAWILEQLRVNALEAREGRAYTTVDRQGNPVEVTSPPNYKASTDALELMYQIITTNEGVLNGIGTNLPRDEKGLRAELRKRLSGGGAPPVIATIVAPADEVAQ